MFGTRALIEAHIRDCETDRKTTSTLFAQQEKKFDKLEEKFDTKFDAATLLRETQHAENQKSLAKIQRIIWIGVGGAGLLGFLTSDWGKGLLEILQRHH